MSLLLLLLLLLMIWREDLSWRSDDEDDNDAKRMYEIDTSRRLLYSEIRMVEKKESGVCVCVCLKKTKCKCFVVDQQQLQALNE